MNDSELDALLSSPLPEADAGAFSVALMEAIARRRSRPARILAWIMVGLLTVIVALAGVWGAMAAPSLADPFAVPATLMVFVLLLSLSVLRSARL